MLLSLQRIGATDDDISSLALSVPGVMVLEVAAMAWRVTTEWAVSYWVSSPRRCDRRA